MVVGIEGRGMTIEKVERRMRSYLTFSIKNRQVQVVKQTIFECSFVVNQFLKSMIGMF